MKSVRQSLLLLPGLLGLAFSGCQAVFGDYDVEPPAPELPIVCASRAYRCSGALLERCSDDRSRWDLVEECASAEQCNLNSESCRPCTPGELMCNGAELLLCGAGSVWSLQQTCASPALCRVAQGGAPAGECVTAACAPGTRVCHGAELLRCSDGGNRYRSVGVCATDEVCQRTLANDPQAERCEPAACAPGESWCEGGQLRRCNAARTGWDVTECGSPGNCSAAAGACRACTPGAVECNHGELRECSGAGDWTTLETCASPALCDATARSCIEPACDQPGILRCTPDAPLMLLEECSAELEWNVIDRCASARLCDPTRRECLDQGCEAGQQRCSGDLLQGCDSDRAGFITLQTCAPGTCDAVRGECSGGCTTGEVRCNDVHFEQCIDGRWERQARCLTPELCSATGASPGCREPVCGSYLGTTRCAMYNLEICPPGRHEWQHAEPCERPSLCDAGPAAPGGTADVRPGFGAGICFECTPGDVVCEGNALRECQGNGELATVQACTTRCVADAAGARCDP